MIAFYIHAYSTCRSRLVIVFNSYSKRMLSLFSYSKENLLHHTNVLTQPVFSPYDFYPFLFLYNGFYFKIIFKNECKKKEWNSVFFSAVSLNNQPFFFYLSFTKQRNVQTLFFFYIPEFISWADIVKEPF